MLAISKTHDPEPDLFCQPCWVRKPVFSLFVNLFRSDCQIANEGPFSRKIKASEGLVERKEKEENVQSDYN